MGTYLCAVLAARDVTGSRQPARHMPATLRTFSPPSTLDRRKLACLSSHLFLFLRHPLLFFNFYVHVAVRCSLLLFFHLRIPFAPSLSLTFPVDPLLLYPDTHVQTLYNLCILSDPVYSLLSSSATSAFSLSSTLSIVRSLFRVSSNSRPTNLTCLPEGWTRLAGPDTDVAARDRAPSLWPTLSNWYHSLYSSTPFLRCNWLHANGARCLLTESFLSTPLN